jgi:hypothetical protein
VVEPELLGALPEARGVGPGVLWEDDDTESRARNAMRDSPRDEEVRCRVDGR